jgi:serine/threonine protein kinase/Flp pilus assembly protein TadD
LLALADLGHSLHDGAAVEPAQAQPPEETRGALGDYRIVREIGRGGMGVVYEAEQVSLGRKVALKVLPFAAMLDQKQLQRFQNEARAAASLRHPNIVQVHFVGCERAVHFYAMDHIEGQTLGEVIRHLRGLEGLEGDAPDDADQAVANLADSLASGRFAPPKASSAAYAPTEAYTYEQTPKEVAGAERSEPPAAETKRTPQAAISSERSTKSPAYFRSIAEIGVQVAEALDHAHEHGVIHRDVKPSNVILDNSGKPWVTDFGLARIETDATLTVSGDLLGTVRYMSPEQALAKRIVVDHRTDVYSLGVTLYELLTLQPVFSGQDRQELLRQIAFEEPKPPRGLNRAVPEEIETIVLKAMAKNPAERYDTAQELADDLRRFLEDRPIRARRPTLVQLAAKWSRRHKPIVWSAVVSTFVLLVAGLVGLGTGNVMITKERDAKDQALVAKDEALDEKTAALKEKHAALVLAKANLLKAEAERQRAESNLTLALDALDTVYLRTIGRDRLLGKSDPDQARRELSNTERTLIEAGLDFYAQIASQNEESTPATFETARAHLQIAMLQASLDEGEAADAAFSEAIARLKRLTESFPKNADYFKQLGIAYVALGNHSRWYPWFPQARETFADAARALTKSIELNPKDAEVYSVRAEAHFNLRRWEQALEDCSQAIQLRPNDAALYVRRSRALCAKGEHAKAIDDCNSALRIDPKSLWALHIRSICYRLSGRYNEALEDANSILLVKPDAWWALGQRALNYIYLGAYEKAIADYCEVIRHESEKSGAYPYRAEAYSALGRYDEALADAKRFVELWPDDAVVALTPAQMLLLADRTKEYRQACVEILDRFGHSEDAVTLRHVARACVLAPKAVPDPMVPVQLAQRAVSRDPSAGTLNTLGMAHLRAVQLDEAARRFHESLDSYPDWDGHFLNWLGLALVHHERGETEDTRQCLGKAIELMTEHPSHAVQARIDGRLLRREVERLLGKSEEEKHDTENDQEAPIARPKPEDTNTAKSKPPPPEAKSNAQPKEKPE